MKAATVADYNISRNNTISIHAAREGGDAKPIKANKTFAISIHAAREGGDLLAVYARKVKPISIPAAREGGDEPATVDCCCKSGFQSTPPVKAATLYICSLL